MEENYDNSIFFKIPYGIFVATTSYEDKKYGCIVNTFIQVADNPVQAVVSIHKESITCEMIEKSNKCIIGLVSEKLNMNIISHFGKQSGHSVDKFDPKYSEIFNYELSENNNPYIKEGMVGNVECEVTSTIDLGTHYLFILKILNVNFINKQENMMTYEFYRENRNKVLDVIKTQEKKAQYICSVCHYVYDGEVPFEDLPDTYVCPVCGKPKSVFVKVE